MMTEYEYVNFTITRNPNNTSAEVKFTQQNKSHSGLVEPNMPKHNVIKVGIEPKDSDEDLMKKALDKISVD